MQSALSKKETILLYKILDEFGGDNKRLLSSKITKLLSIQRNRIRANITQQFDQLKLNF